MMNVAEMTLLILIPISWAVSKSLDTARMAMPIFVLLISMTSPTTSRITSTGVTSVTTFVIGTFLAGVASLLYFTNYTTVIQTSGAMPGLKAFVAAVFGGIGSIPGAVIGAFIIGIMENIIKGLDVILFKLGLIKAPMGLATFSDAFTFALLIIILIVKPTGLFGEKVTDKV